MRDADRFKLRFGPYQCPSYRVGEKVTCEFLQKDVVVGGMTDSPIQWPYPRRKGPRSPILCDDLIRAVQTEAVIAVAQHWGVSKKTVGKWRRALEVPRTNAGTRQLFSDWTPERLTEDAREKQKVAMG